jgi:single-strand DNA-binding protein
MASFNKVILMGNLTRDPQLKYLPNQMAIAEFGLAMNRKFRTQSGEDREEVTFVDCTAFGKTGELINQYFTKGKPIFIEGRIKYDSWDDKQGGGKRSKITVVIENFQFVGGREGGGPGGGGGASHDEHESGGGGSGGGGYEQRRPAPNRSPQQSAPQRPMSRPPQQQQPEPPFSENQEFKEDDIPF